jgi:hypothetical protein
MKPRQLHEWANDNISSMYFLLHKWITIEEVILKEMEVLSFHGAEHLDICLLGYDTS